jgi:uncharacterized OB-fold protein
MEVEKEIEHKCPKCGHVWVSIEIIDIEPPEREEDDR